jgi:hypothetical protein
MDVTWGLWISRDLFLLEAVKKLLTAKIAKKIR